MARRHAPCFTSQASTRDGQEGRSLYVDQLCWSAIHYSFSHSTRFREMAPSVSDKGIPSCRRVSDQKLIIPHASKKILTDRPSSRARQMRLPTSFTPVLTHRPNHPMPRRPRSLLTPVPARPPSPDAGDMTDAAEERPT